MPVPFAAGVRWLLAGAVILAPLVPARAERDPQIEARVEALLARMTLAEKVGQLNLTSRAPSL